MVVQGMQVYTCLSLPLWGSPLHPPGKGFAPCTGQECLRQASGVSSRPVFEGTGTLLYQMVLRPRHKCPRFGPYVIRCKSLLCHDIGRRSVGSVVGALLKAGAA